MESYNCNKDPYASLRASTAPQWVEEMRMHYAATGSYRAADLMRLLGDPSRGVEIGPRAAPPEIPNSPKQHP
jgi:hypothetical protein